MKSLFPSSSISMVVAAPSFVMATVFIPRCAPSPLVFVVSTKVPLSSVIPTAGLPPAGGWKSTAAPSMAFPSRRTLPSTGTMSQENFIYASVKFNLVGVYVF